MPQVTLSYQVLPLRDVVAVKSVQSGTCNRETAVLSTLLRSESGC